MDTGLIAVSLLALIGLATTIRCIVLELRVSRLLANIVALTEDSDLPPAAVNEQSVHINVFWGLKRENRELKMKLNAMAERVAHQSELLGRAAERQQAV